MITLDLGCDLHTHSNLTDGAHTPVQMAEAAAVAGLHTWGLSDHVRADSAWVGDYAQTVRGIEAGDVDIRCGVEAKILDATGNLDLPPTLPHLDYVLIADHQFPSVAGPQHPRAVAAELAGGQITPDDVLDQLVAATCAAVRQAPFHPVVVHPFSLLPKMGLSEDQLGEDHLRELAAACRDAGAAVEINEKWRCPSRPVVAALHALGIGLVAGSDAHRCADVGSWSYVASVLSDRPGPAVPRAVATA